MSCVMCCMSYAVSIRLALCRNNQTIIFRTFVFNLKIMVYIPSESWYVVSSLYGVTFQAT